jgi:hypothetical protein
MQKRVTFPSAVCMDSRNASFPLTLIVSGARKKAIENKRTMYWCFLVHLNKSATEATLLGCMRDTLMKLLMPVIQHNKILLDSNAATRATGLPPEVGRRQSVLQGN